LVILDVYGMYPFCMLLIIAFVVVIIEIDMTYCYLNNFNMKNFFLLFAIIFSSVVFAQEQETNKLFDNCLIKTRPWQNFVAYNPNLSIEKPINTKYSFEIDLIYRNRTWYSEGGENNFGWYTPSVGYRLLGGFRRYMGKNREAPFGWFVGAQMVMNQSFINDIDLYGFHGEFAGTHDVKLFWAEFIPVIGYQFHISKRITSEFYIGPSVFLYHSEQIDSNENDIIPISELAWLPEITWTVGFLLD